MRADFYERNFLDRQVGAKQRNKDANPPGRDIQDIVYVSDTFKIRLDGSLRLHGQRSDVLGGGRESSVPEGM